MAAGLAFGALSFSDLTVRCTIIPDGSSVDLFLTVELLFLAHRQFALAAKGLLLRGGLCMGPILFDLKSAIIFGPALVRSYDLEREYAIFPRIVIAQDLAVPTAGPSSPPQWAHYVNQGDDGMYFVDYLFGAMLDRLTFLPRPKDPLTMLRERRNMVLGLIGDSPKNHQQRLRQKYLWLARYHNEATKRLRESTKGNSTLQGVPVGQIADEDYLGCEIPVDRLRF